MKIGSHLGPGTMTGLASLAFREWGLQGFGVLYLGAWALELSGFQTMCGSKFVVFSASSCESLQCLELILLLGPRYYGPYPCAVPSG